MNFLYEDIRSIWFHHIFNNYLTDLSCNSFRGNLKNGRATPFFLGTINIKSNDQRSVLQKDHNDCNEKSWPDTENITLTLRQKVKVIERS